MKLLLTVLVLISAVPAHALDILRLDSGYIDGAYSASLTGNSDSKILPAVAELYTYAGATRDSANTDSTFYYFPGDPKSQEALIDSFKDGTDPQMPDLARYTWNFSIPHNQIIQLGASTQGLLIVFSGPTAETLLKGIKVAVEKGRAEITSTAMGPMGEDDGHGYSMGPGSIGCEERRSVQKVTCSFTFSGKKD